MVARLVAVGKSDLICSSFNGIGVVWDIGIVKIALYFAAALVRVEKLVLKV